MSVRHYTTTDNNNYYLLLMLNITRFPFVFNIDISFLSYLARTIDKKSLFDVYYII